MKLGSCGGARRIRAGCSMAWTTQRCREPPGALLVASPSTATFAASASRRGVRQSVGSVGRRIELLDHLKLRLARREAAILRGPVETMRERSSAVVPVTAVASRALQEQAGVLFGAVCVNPRALSPEAAEFMLSVAASQCVLSPDESLAASHVDLALQGVHPRTAGPVLLACTTTMLGAAIDTADVEKALRRADLWRRAVGPAFSVLPVVAGYALPQKLLISPNTSAYFPVI